MSNIVTWFGFDLFSKKMGTLLFDRLDSETNELKKHLLATLIIKERPNDWSVKIQNYITSIAKNSFYLSDVHFNLEKQYSYSFATAKTLYEIQYLIKMCLAKHKLGTRAPGKEAINKIPASALPQRKVGNIEPQ